MSIEELWGVVNKQQKEIDYLKKWVRGHQKKINVIAWLNSNRSVMHTFQQWQSSIEIGQKQLENIFDRGFIEGIYYIILESLPIEKEHLFPIICFEQKPHTFYIFESEWKILPHDDFDQMIQSIHFRIIQEFKKWQDLHIDDIMCNEHTNNIYQKNIKKVMGPSLKESGRKLRSKLFMYLKLNLKNIIVYDFSF